jgi:hypothetical protein
MDIHDVEGETTEELDSAWTVISSSKSSAGGTAG